MQDHNHMTDIVLEQAQARLLAPTGVAVRDLERVLNDLCGRQIDLADLYLEMTRSEAWSLEDSIVKEGVHSIRQGAGVRAVSGEQTGFAYSDDLTVPALMAAARTARAITRQGQARDIRVAAQAEFSPALYAAVDRCSKSRSPTSSRCCAGWIAASARPTPTCAK
jgi:TldD protein